MSILHFLNSGQLQAKALKTRNLLFVILFVFLCSCRTHSHKNIIYNESPQNSDLSKQELNVFAPAKSSDSRPVLIFIHGGKWNSGNKEMYNFLGRRFARKNVVTVIIDYPLSPEVTYREMAKATAQAVKWTKGNIDKYGGDPDKIFISGHSAGGHLAALVSMDKQYLQVSESQAFIKGCILIDAGGLDMYGYLKKQQFEEGHTYLETFTNDPQTWQQASPLYQLQPAMPPMLIYMGEKTYPSIISSHQRFMEGLQEYREDPNYYVLKGKKHIPMITQFFWSWNPLYDEIIEFMDDQEVE